MKELRLRDHRVEKFEWKEVEVLIKQALENLEKLKEVLERILLHDGSAPASILGYYLDDLDGYCSIFCPLGYKPYKEIGHEIRTNSKALEGAIETGLMCAAIHTHVGAALDVWENWDCMKSGILRIVNDPILKVHIEWIGTWLEVYIIPNVSPITLSRYQGMIKRYIKPIIGHMQVQQRNTLAVQAWVNGLKISPSSGKPMAAATVKHAYHVLKGCMHKAVLAGIIPRSPCMGIMLPKGQKKAAIIYDELQIKQLLNAAKGTEMELVIDMELCLGLRRGERLGLWWQDIDWEKKQIHIIRNRVVVNGKSVVKEPKTENSVRTIDMPDQLVQKLKLHQWACRANQQKLGAAYTCSDYIIVHPDGKPIYPEYLSQMLTKLQKKAKLPQCRFHDLRHLCATIMLL